MTQESISVKLYEAIQDGKDCFVEERKVVMHDKDKVRYFIHINGSTYPISKKLALLAIKRHVRVENTIYYQLGNFCYRSTITIQL